MAVTPSNMLPLATIAPEFNLFDTISGEYKSLSYLQGQKGTLIMFICNHCPYVIHIKEQLIALAQDYAKQGIQMIAISANDSVNYPQDAPEKMTAMMTEWGNPFAAYLYDESQQTAKAYLAACTPDFYLFDDSLACVYRGRLDAATPKNNKRLNGADLRRAMDCLLSGEKNIAEQIPSMGCNIKWK